MTEKSMDHTIFAVKIEVDHGENVSCPEDFSPNKTFCNSDSPDYNWELCPLVNGNDGSIQFVFLKRSTNIKIPFLLTWLCILHGNMLQLVIELENYIYDHIWTGYSYYYDDNGPISLTLKIEELNCNPSFPFVKCILSELLSWVSYNRKMHLINHNNILLNR